MLILPPGHAQEVHRRRPLRAREKRMIGGIGAALLALIVVLGVSLASTSPRSGHGCVSVSLAYSTGGQQVYRCGAAARALCAGVGVPGGITGPPARTVAAACRQAGIPAG